MPDNPYKVGDKVWWTNLNFQVVLATVKKADGMACLIHAEGERILQYIRFKRLFRSEKIALVDAKVQVQTRMLEKRAEMDALAETRTAIRQRLTEIEDA